MKIDQFWFEMPDLRKKVLDNSVWIPLRSEKTVRSTTEFGNVDYFEDFFGAGSLMVPLSDRNHTKHLNWMDIGIIKTHNASYKDGFYRTADVYRSDDFVGTNLLINQSYDNNYDINEWHLHQDLVISLGLKRELDVWVCPSEGYVEVAKLERDMNGKPVLLSIKNQFLKDYLHARNSGLYISSYYCRNAILESKSILSWKDDFKFEKKGKDLWECNINEIHEGRGFPYGQKISVSKVGRTDIFENEDVPDMTEFPTEKNTRSEFYEKGFKGRKIYRITSELWKYDWIKPGKRSHIVLGQTDNTKVFFIINAEGQKKSCDSFKRGGKWLWFKPEMVTVFLSMRGSFLNWYSKDTGKISCGPNGGIHFGVNSLGLITVYAKDIMYLPVWQQQIWSGFNIAPEGGISKELHDSQIKAEPADTLAPEDFIQSVIMDINEVSLEKLGCKIFRGHQSVVDILPLIHRFRAFNEKGIFSLAKDIARIIIDDINIEDLQKIVLPPKGTKWGSLKTIENLLAQKIPKESARDLLSPLVGIYELRHVDAHLPSSNIESAFKLVGIDRNLPPTQQGYMLLFVCVNHLHLILSVLQNFEVLS